MKYGLVSAAYPPELDGIGDYTWWMAETLGAQNDIRVFTRKGLESRVRNVKVVSFFDESKANSFASLMRHVKIWSEMEDETCWLILQYNPFSWGRRGFCPLVPYTLRAIKRLPKAPNIAVMFHETHVPRWPWKFMLMQIWQKPLFRQMCRVADIAFSSTEKYARQVHSVNPTLQCRALGVGSNVSLCELSQVNARAVLGIPREILVLGVFGSAHISRRLDWIAQTLRAAREKRGEVILLYVGGHGQSVLAVCGSNGLIDAGIQDEMRVGLYLRAMDLILAPFSDGISSRRGSIMASLQHGIPVASTLHEESDQVFQGKVPANLLLSKARSIHGFATDVSRWLSDCSWKPRVPCEELASFYERHFSWGRIAGAMTTDLGDYCINKAELLKY